MNKHSPRLRGHILNQVYRIWLVRKLAPVLVAELAIVALVLYELGKTVFVQRVFENALKVFFVDPTQIFHFLATAFVHTHPLTKVLVFGLLVLVAFVLRHLTQGILRFILVRQNYFGKVR